MFTMNSGCNENKHFMENPVQYACSMIKDGGKMWYVTEDTFNGVRYYDMELDVHGSLCPDPLCDHRQQKCILFNLKIINLAMHKNQLYMLAMDLNTAFVGFYCYDFEIDQFSNIYTFENGGVYNSWCVCNDELYCIYAINEEENDVYKMELHDNVIVPKKITHNHGSMIYEFGLYNGNVYYYDNGYLTCNGKPFIELVPRFRFQIFGDYLYYTKFTYEPEWDPAENPENVKYAQWAYDLYRRSLIDDDVEDELLIERGYGYFIITDKDIYYTPYDISTAFSYPMPYGNDGEMVYTYDMSSGKINKLSLQTRCESGILDKENFLIERLIDADDNDLLFLGVDYCDVDQEHSTASDYYDNKFYYHIALANGDIQKIKFEVNPVLTYP